MTQPSLLSDLSPRFDGADISVQHDQVRLTTQLDRILTVIGDGKWRTLHQIATLSQAPEASVSAQLRNARKPRFGAHVIERRTLGDRSRGLYAYRLGKS